METFPALLALYAPVPGVNSPNKGQCRGALMFSLIYAWTNGSVNNRDADGLRRYRNYMGVASDITPSLLLLYKDQSTQH